MKKHRDRSAMPQFIRVIALAATILAALSLAGCGSVSSFLAGSMGDLIPAWAGGLPADAPPRPGTAKYDDWVKQHTQGATDAAAQPNAGQTTSQSSADAVH
jgi:hypothetical protein